MAALTEAQLRICAHACITRYDRGEGNVATIIGSYVLDEQQCGKVMEIILSKRSDVMKGNVEDSSSVDVTNNRGETVKWYSSIFRKKTV